MNDTYLSERERLFLRNIVIDQYNLRAGELPTYDAGDADLSKEEVQALAVRLGLPYSLPPMSGKVIFSEDEYRADPRVVIDAAERNGYARVCRIDGTTLMSVSLEGRLRR